MIADCMIADTRCMIADACSMIADGMMAGGYDSRLRLYDSRPSASIPRRYAIIPYDSRHDCMISEGRGMLSDAPPSCRHADGMISHTPHMISYHMMEFSSYNVCYHTKRYAIIRRTRREEVCVLGDVPYRSWVLASPSQPPVLAR